MTWIDTLIIAIAGLVLSLPLCLILELLARSIAFFIRSVRSPSWRERPWSPWKIMDWTGACRDATFFNRPPQLTRSQSLIVRAVSIFVAYCGVWAWYFHSPR